MSHRKQLLANISIYTNLAVQQQHSLNIYGIKGANRDDGLGDKVRSVQSSIEDNREKPKKHQDELEDLDAKFSI